MRTRDIRIAIVITAILGAAALRLVPHPPNFTPIGAMGLFSGAHLRRRWLAWVAPLGAMLLADAVIGFYPHMEFVYGSFALIVLIGSASLARVSVVCVGSACLASSLLFFGIADFGVWVDSGSYPHTWSGVLACYVAAFPVLWNVLVG